MNKKHLLLSLIFFTVLYFGALDAKLFSSRSASQTAAVATSVPSPAQNPADQAISADVTQIDGLNQSIVFLQDKILSIPAGSRLSDLTLKSASPQLESALKSRAVLMLKLAKERPELFLKLTLIKKYRDKIPAALIKYVEQETSIKRGVVEVLHIDDFAHPENSRFDYFIRQGNTKLSFYPVGDFGARSGTKVNVTGFKLGSVFVAKVQNNLQVVETPPLDSVGNQRTDADGLINKSSLLNITTTSTQPLIITNDNTFVLFDDDFSSPDRIKWSKSFYRQHPGDSYDFLYFFYDKGPGSGADFLPAQSSRTFLSSYQGWFNSAQLYGSQGKLLGIAIDHATLTNLDRVGFIDTLFFGILQHELFHYWGVYLPHNLEDASCDSAHWVGYIGSRLSCGGDSNSKFFEKDNNYYFYYNCAGTPRFHDFELYSMGLKPAEDVKDKVVIYNPGKDFNNDLHVKGDCEKVTKVPEGYILKSYSLKDFVNILGPSVKQSKNNFDVAFILVKPLGLNASNDEMKFLHWWAEKAPIAWYKATGGLSTLNNKVPKITPLPVISNVEIIKDNSQIRVSWQTDRPAVSAVFLKNTKYGYTKLIYRSKLSPPEYSENHLIIVDPTDDSNIGYYGTQDFEVRKIISVDENLNIATYPYKSSPLLTNAASPVFPGRTLILIGSGFSPDGNSVRLTSVASSSAVYYVRNLSSDSDGSTLSFTVATSTAPGRYYLAVQASQSDWSDSGRLVKKTVVEIKAPIGEPSASASSSSASQPFCHTWTKPLTIDDRGDDVLALSQALVKEGIPSAKVQSIFDEELASRLVVFQEKYAADVLTPYHWRLGTGFLGASTRAKLNQLYGCGNQSATTTSKAGDEK